MTLGMALLFMLMVVCFIVADTLRDRKQKARILTRPPTEISRRRTASLVRIEEEVDAKLDEIRREQEAAEPPAPVAPAAVTPVPAPEPTAPGVRDPLNDTRCMQALNQKAEEIERIAKERGLTG